MEHPFVVEAQVKHSITRSFRSKETFFL
jgi:hypothetical protein